MGELGSALDVLRLGALGLALLAPLLVPRLLGPMRRRGSRVPFGGFGLGAALCAAGLSALYLHVILRGGPRIIDATSYWLEARALSEGWLAWPLAEPEQAVLGRFLLRTPAPVGLAQALGLGAGQELPGPGVSVIFPPGYPALLALGMRLGAPLVVGPVIGAALVFATMALARAVCRSARTLGVPLGAPGPDAERTIVRTAAVLSVLCAALRYHSADTMSHGLAALCFTIALAAALTAAEPDRSARQRSVLAALCGLSTGWLAATRPASALALGLCLALAGGVWLRGRLGAKASWPETCARRHAGAGELVVPALLFALMLVPGLTLWAAHQKAATGSFFGSAQHAYYAVSDGPAGCFRYGFGQGVGCLGEHGDFVRHHLAHGYGLLEALGTSLRRLQMHLGDPLDFAPLFLLVPLGAWLGRRVAAVRVLALGIGMQIACYAPFYFDGNYPGGGARMLAEVLPLEHVLASLGLGLLAARAPRGIPGLGSLVTGTVLLALLGYGLDAGRGHALLRDRDGGRPLFEPGVLERAGIDRGLVLVGSDAGFGLGHQPRSLGDLRSRSASANAHGGIVVARGKGDDLDRLTWEELGRPPVFRYVLRQGHDPDSDDDTARPEQSRPWIEPVVFDARPPGQLGLRIEGESLWPAREQHDAWAWPEHTGLGCASGGKWLAIRPSPAGGSPAVHGAAVRLDDPLGKRPYVSLTLPARALGGRGVRLTLGLGPQLLSLPSAAESRPEIDPVAADGPRPEPAVDGPRLAPDLGAADGPCAFDVEVLLRAEEREIHRWNLVQGSEPRCVELEHAVVPAGLDRLELVIVACTELALDLVAATPSGAGERSVR